MQGGGPNAQAPARFPSLPASQVVVAPLTMGRVATNLITADVLVAPVSIFESKSDCTE
jgi:hypothetical protein